MRTGVFTVQHALTPEAATLVKQAVSLARRRGHAQVTPLHVATVMLSSSTGLLRRACLQSHSHPLQYNALELCFNVALNRLPSSTPTPLLVHHHSPFPTVSNALIAAFKRAQAHQRRGSIENNTTHQQPILTALKIEIEQLAISILDDPSISRVMREAGFSSTQVKSNLEESVSVEVACSSSSSQKPVPSSQAQPVAVSHVWINSDVLCFMDTLMSKRRRNTVIVGECLASAEAVARGVMEKLEKGDVPAELRNVKSMNVPLLSMKNLSKEEIEERILDLRCLIKSYTGRGIVLYLGDLRWINEFRLNYFEQKRSYYCPAEYMIMELRRLLCGIGEGGKLWLMATATFQTYMRCKDGNPSLNSLWELHPFTIPVGSLELSLNLESDVHESQYRSKVPGGSTPKQSCTHADLLNNGAFESGEVRRKVPLMVDDPTVTISQGSNLPSWLQKYKEENKTADDHHEELFGHVNELYKKWDIFGNSVLHGPHHYSSSSWPSLKLESENSPKEYQFWRFDQKGDDDEEAEGSDNELNFFPEIVEHKPELLSNPNSSPNSATSSEAMEDSEDDLQRFKELTDDNLSILSGALERKVPWQKRIIPDITKAVLECRSGTMNKKYGKSRQCQREAEKQETWLVFFGVDSKGKEKIARELAKLVFGSHNNFTAINGRSRSSIGISPTSTRSADSTENIARNKRRREAANDDNLYLNKFKEALQENPHRVFFLDDFDQINYSSRKGMKEAIERGRIELVDGERVFLKDAIVIISCESFSSMSRASSPPPPSNTRQKVGENENLKESPKISLDLNISIGGDDNGGEEQLFDEVGILESIDKLIVFRRPDVEVEMEIK